ncbi:MAG: hypothetical protein HYV09_36050 [Deltaproteobacteria bacterium]|nr:hypothetical protein [Deltaproteobacteria bacterium]
MGAFSDSTCGPTRDLDLATRISAAPSSAGIRGVMLHAVDAALRASGVKAPVRPAIPSYALIPVREYLARVHAAGALVGPTPLIRSIFPACRSTEPLIERTGNEPWSATVRVRW